MKNLFVLLLAGVGSALIPQPATACEVCDVIGIGCSADTCDLVIACVTPPATRTGRAECYDWWGISCQTGGEYCRWAAQPSPTHEEALLFAATATGSRNLCGG